MALVKAARRWWARWWRSSRKPRTQKSAWASRVQHLKSRMFWAGQNSCVHCLAAACPSSQIGKWCPLNSLQSLRSNGWNPLCNRSERFLIFLIPRPSWKSHQCVWWVLSISDLESHPFSNLDILKLMDFEWVTAQCNGQEKEGAKCRAVPHAGLRRWRPRRSAGLFVAISERMLSQFMEPVLVSWKSWRFQKPLGPHKKIFSQFPPHLFQDSRRLFGFGGSDALEPATDTATETAWKSVGCTQMCPHGFVLWKQVFHFCNQLQFLLFFHPAHPSAQPNVSASSVSCRFPACCSAEEGKPTPRWHYRRPRQMDFYRYRRSSESFFVISAVNKLYHLYHDSEKNVFFLFAFFDWLLVRFHRALRDW